MQKTTEKSVIENALGDHAEIIEKVYTECLAKETELETLAKTVVFPKVRQLILDRLAKNEKYAKLQMFLEDCLTTGGDKEKISWLDHLAWVITDSITHHKLEMFPSMHVDSTITMQTLRENGYYNQDTFMDEVGEFSGEIQDLGFVFNADALGTHGVTILFIEMP